MVSCNINGLNKFISVNVIVSSHMNLQEVINNLKTMTSKANVKVDMWFLALTAKWADRLFTYSDTSFWVRAEDREKCDKNVEAWTGTCHEERHHIGKGSMEEYMCVGINSGNQYSLITFV